MNQLFKKTLLVLCCSSALFITACNDSDNDHDNFVAPEKFFVSELPYKFDKPDGASADPIQVMTYNMTNVQGKKATATAMVIFPQTAQPQDGYRVVVWEHGTLGNADNCAPTNNIQGARFKDPLAKSLLEAGYVIVAPDYEGMGTKGIHPYLHLESEAKSAIYAVKAAQERYGSKLNKQWMSAGQSQGGQASLGTAEFANSDVNYKGAVAGAPASSLDTIIFKVAPAALKQAEALEIAAGKTLAERAAAGSIGAYATLLSYAAFAGVGIKAVDPSFEYRDIFLDQRSKLIAEKAEGSTGENGLCLDSPDAKNLPEQSIRYLFTMDIVKFLTENPGKSVLDYPGLDEVKFYQLPQIAQFIKNSQPGTKKLDKPVLIIQGTADMSVPYPVTEALVKKLKDDLKSPDITFLPVKDASHTAAIVQKNPELLAFIQKHMPAK